MKLIDLKKRMKNYGSQIKALAAVLLIYGVLAAIGHGCPIRYVTGIPCPGCGLSRAYLALLQLNPIQAFKYHPLFWAVPVLALACFCYTRRKSRIALVLVVLSGAGLIGLYLYRLSMGDPVLEVDVRSGLIYRSFQFVFNFRRFI